MKLFYSIIIPTLNEEKYLPLLLSDLNRQKEKNFEVIVVDGNSIDNTKKEAEKYKKTLPLSFFTVKRRNVSFQKDFGSKKAKGNYLIFSDADSRIGKSFIKKLNKEISKRKYLIYLPALSTKDLSYQDKTMIKLANLIIEASQISKTPAPTGGLMIFEKNFFEFINGYTIVKSQDKKKMFPEDNEILIKAKNCGVKAKFMKNIKVKFSLRRMKTEGRLEIIRKYVVLALHTIIKGKVPKNAFDYEMGGHVHEKNHVKQKEKLKYIVDNVKKWFSKIQKEL